MRIGLFTDGLAHLSLDDALEWLAAELPHVRDLEIGTGGFSPTPHCDLQAMLADGGARRAWLDGIESRGFRVTALNVNGNPLELPGHDPALRDTIRLAAALEVETVACMSGGRAELSGGAWFPGVEDEVEAYWRDRVLPYWKEVAELVASVDTGLRLCLELEPGSAAFNVTTVERLLEIGPVLAVNIDPSHFLWQGIDSVAAVARLAGRIGFAHGKDTVLLPERVALDGLLDRTAWRYTTIGHGHDAAWWSAFIGALRAAGYDGVISVEHEDAEVSPEHGIVEGARALAAAMGETAS
jgi:sugar phosphate isomerase/epimerase